MKQNARIFSVGELTRQIKGVLEQGFANVSVEGELSNCKRHSSGHIYLTLKDEKSQISGVIWRNRAEGLFFTPQDGMRVIVRGNVTLYELRGVYQIDIAQIQPAGVGDLQIAFEQLKNRLAAEGYFDAERKKPIPQFPRRIGIVTSPTGAALRDIVNVIRRRCPPVELILCPVKVQGPGSADEIAGAIKDLNNHGLADVMIIGRGGGSLEDLWAFNEEVVAEAIYRSHIPVISAVGHEVDFTIADFVADLRAPTPSAAAELVVPTLAEMVEIVSKFYYTSEQIVNDLLLTRRDRIRTLLRSYSFNKPIDLLRQHSQRADDLQLTIQRIVSHRIALVHQQFASLEKRIHSVNPHSILERGYAMVLKGKKAISRVGELRTKDEITLKMYDGIIPAMILETVPSDQDIKE